ncbi:beta-lactamase regulating signal transducer with metallopeptidase domain [Chitinophaga niastensis]|uniref:Beta-lactamase regulating signal transducer with metallopeptidase domain n=1 Tax=Chitinophaga niastensis TaxID=536980 RepID=A0A2P8HSW4_CHINA|nr:M56 family metallopeptidase [Chitinophaga niastensis]PSL49264.1 beta-lactamase regulating signal transducer with metallopeptidase domain [Chitinophaga niastensis]
MPTLFLYILQTSGCMAIFYLLYIIFFRKETFYRYNRILLLSAFVFSVILPLLPIPAISWSVKAPKEGSDTQVLFNTNVVAHTQSSNVVLSQHWWDSLVQNAGSILLIIYISVAFILILLHIIPLLKIRRLMQLGKIYKEDYITYVHVPGLTTPFSFLRIIFFDPNAYEHTELQHVLRHEEAHVQQHHSIDNLLASIYCCLCWINPFAWLSRKALQLNLEYLADQAAVQKADAATSYQYSLLKVGAHYRPASIAHHFNKSFIKNRILMINKTQSPRLRAWKYLLIVPALSIAAGLLSAAKPATNTDSTEKKYMITYKDVIYGVVTPQTTEADLNEMKRTLAAKDFTLTLKDFKRNEKGEIDDVQLEVVDSKAGRSVSTHMNESAGNVIFFYCEKKGMGIGTNPPGHKSFPNSLLYIVARESRGPVAGLTTDTLFTQRFPGGTEAYKRFLAKNIRYPKGAHDAKITGLVSVQYKLNMEGYISDIKVLSAPREDMAEEIMRTLGKMPRFATTTEGNSETETISLTAAFALEGENGEVIKNPDPKKADLIIIGYTR